MTKQEAIQAMQEGHKVRHAFFMESEWIMKSPNNPNNYVTEEGYEVSADLFWMDRNGNSFLVAWEIVPASPEPAKSELTVTIAGKEYPLNLDQTHVMFGGEWREIIEDQDGEKYIFHLSNTHYLDAAPEPATVKEDWKQLDKEVEEMEKALWDEPTGAPPAEAEIRGERMDELKWREGNPEAAKWYDAFKGISHNHARLTELAVKMQKENKSLYAALKEVLELHYKTSEPYRFLPTNTVAEIEYILSSIKQN